MEKNYSSFLLTTFRNVFHPALASPTISFHKHDIRKKIIRADETFKSFVTFISIFLNCYLILNSFVWICSIPFLRDSIFLVSRSSMVFIYAENSGIDHVSLSKTTILLFLLILLGTTITIVEHRLLHATLTKREPRPTYLSPLKTRQVTLGKRPSLFTNRAKLRAKRRYYAVPEAGIR